MIEDDESFKWQWPPLRSITDIALHHINLRLTCPACRHERVLSGPAVWWLFHQRRWEDYQDQVPRRFRCTRCWIAARRIVRPRVLRTMAPETGDPIPLPDEREWKRLGSRYRN